MITKTTRMWAVRLLIPKIPGDTGERKYNQNANLTCLCDTFEEAHRMVRERHPDAVIWCINHKAASEYYYEDGRGHPILVSAPTSELPGEEPK